MRRLKGVVGWIWVWLGVAAWPVQALAAAPEPAGFTVAPAFQEVSIRGDQAESEYNLQVRNNSKSDQNFRLSVVDFGSLDEEGGVAFLGAPTTELEHKYGLASWMTLEKDALFVPAGGSANLVVHVSNRASLAPGGHYGAVLATAVTDTGQIGVGSSVGIKQVLSSLVLATKESGAQRSLKLKDQSSNAAFWHLPTKTEERFENTGNVHVVPRGVVSVLDPRGKEVVRGALNEASGAILPESVRRYKTPLTVVGGAWLPGRYRLVTTYRYDGADGTKTLATSFWYVGAVVVWVVGLVVLAVAGWLAWWLWRRRGRRRRAAK
jgi:hypothetical protein